MIDIIISVISTVQNSLIWQITLTTTLKLMEISLLLMSSTTSHPAVCLSVCHCVYVCLSVIVCVCVCVVMCYVQFSVITHYCPVPSVNLLSLRPPPPSHYYSHSQHNHCVALTCWCLLTLTYRQVCLFPVSVSLSVSVCLSASMSWLWLCDIGQHRQLTMSLIILAAENVGWQGD